jgi:hypothetical protein
MKEQVRTITVSALKIMSTREFALGVEDGRDDEGRGCGYPAEYDDWDVNGQWNYERGRQWALQAPSTVALTRNGRVTAEALRWFIGIL